MVGCCPVIVAATQTNQLVYYVNFINTLEYISDSIYWIYKTTSIMIYRSVCLFKSVNAALFSLPHCKSLGQLLHSDKVGLSLSFVFHYRCIGSVSCALATSWLSSRFGQVQYRLDFIV